MPSITIYLPSYQYLPGLKRNLEIISNQFDVDLLDIRVIVSDDTPSDVIQTFFNDNYSSMEEIYYVTGPKQGAVPNWNSCLNRNQSEYNLFIHHDEYIEHPDFFKVIYEILYKNEYDILFLPLMKELDGKRYKHFPNILKNLFIYFPKLLFACNPFGSPSVVVFKSDLGELFDEKLRWFVDVDWYYRLIRAADKVKIIDDPRLTIVSDLSLEETETTKMGVSELLKSEPPYLMRKHNLPSLLFSKLAKLLRLPVKIYEFF